MAMPLAVIVGLWVKRGGGVLVPSLIALGILYACVWCGVYHFAPELPAELIDGQSWSNPNVVWTLVLMVYCFIASVLPVWVLLQPRDFINSHQLFVALALLVGGVAVAGLTGKADISSAPMIAENIPANAPPVWPFLFITIACGACSGFHCLVSSGTSSKQVDNERDAQYVAYGSMLLEGALAVLVILACCAGLGMGRYAPQADGTMAAMTNEAGEVLTGAAAWQTRYSPTGDWTKFGLGAKVGAFVDGGANFLSTIGIPIELGIGIIAVLVACFAATTLDTATRLQRYVIQELGQTLSIKPLTNKYVATGTAVTLGLIVAMIPAPGKTAGTGGLILWPLFGATNQLLAGLAFMVLVFYLWRRGKPVFFAALPMVAMLLMPAWALLWQMFNPESGWFHKDQWLLFGFGAVITGLQIWMVIEGFLLLPKVKGVVEEPLPPLARSTAASGPNC